MNEEDKEKIKQLEEYIIKIDETLLKVKPQLDLIKKIRKQKKQFLQMINDIKIKHIREKIKNNGK